MFGLLWYRCLAVCVCCCWLGFVVVGLWLVLLVRDCVLSMCVSCCVVVFVAVCVCLLLWYMWLFACSVVFVVGLCL